jgi:hypothetical protein
MKKSKLLYLLVSVNLILIGIVSILLFASFTHEALFKTVETQSLAIKKPGCQSYIQMGMIENDPVVFISDDKGNPRIQLEGGKAPSILLKNKLDKVVARLSSISDDSAVLVLNDTKGAKRFLLQGGDHPGLYLMNEKSQPIANLVVSKKQEPVLTFKDSKLIPRMQLEGGDVPGLYIFNNLAIPSVEMFVAKNGDSNILLNDSSQVPRLNLQGGKYPGIFVKNNKNKTIGSLATLKDGSFGIGLAKEDGVSSSIFKGGKNPGLAFFSNESHPIASIGIMQDVSHLLISGASVNEEILIHGGSPMGMMMLDEQGQVKVYISKHGIFQGQEQNKERTKKKEKFFSYDEDMKILFPDADPKKAQ